MGLFRVMIVHPGVPFSTADVYSGLKAGLVHNGIEVIECRLDRLLQYQQTLHEAGQKLNLFRPGQQWNLPAVTGPYVLQQAIAEWPDLVIDVSGHNLHITTAKAIRKAGLQTAIICTESPYFAEFEAQKAAVYDVVFTMERAAHRIAKQYFPHNERVYYLPHAFNPEVHQPGLADLSKACDVFFVGSLFEERARLFAGVNWQGIHFVRRGYEPGRDEQDIIDNVETVQHYHSAKICLNHHRTTKTFGSGEHIGVGEAESLGPRAYEIPASGGFMLCDDSRSELKDVFGGHIPTYHAGDSADLERQMRYWLQDDRAAERADMVAMAYERVKAHSWYKRADQLLNAVFG